MIRTAKISDKSLLNTMFSEFYSSDAVMQPIPQSYHDAALDELFSDHSLQRCYLLCNGEAPVGYALLSLKFSHEAGGMELWLEELYLRETARGKGLGRALLQELLATARREGIARLRLEVEPDNDRAIGLYRSLGFCDLPYGQMFWTTEERS